MEGFQVDCNAAVNAAGVLALQTQNVLSPQDGVVHFVAPDGTLRGSSPPGTNTLLLGRLTAFEGAAFTGQGESFAFAIQSWDDRGNLVSMGPSRPGFLSIVEDPLGGIAVLVHDSSPAVENYDEQGNLRWRVNLSRDLTAVGGFAVDRAGNTFVMADSTRSDKSVVAQWIDHDGVAGPAFQLLGPQSEFNHIQGEVIVRVGSGLFVHADQWWQLESMSTTLLPAPKWLLDAAGSRLAIQMVRNGRAYGIISLASGPDCASTVEVVTPSGKSCGKATFNAGPGGCFSASAGIGYDGTFVQRVPPPANRCTGDTCTCTWHWWTGFFR
ncbi:MAG: hypothetical protein ACM3PC_01495 [Deltaproteobacteria bacterium]